MNALTFALPPGTLKGSLGETSVSGLLAWAIAYANPHHPYHYFGRRCAVELLCRDQFKRDEQANQALIEMGPKTREVYRVYV